jgi:hypothetical protein
LKWILACFSLSFAPCQTIEQKTDGACSPAVNAHGNVVITCNGINATDLKKLEKGVDILNAVLKQNDAQILSKLDAVLELLTPLQDQVSAQRKELNAIQQYTEISKLNILGSHFPPNSDIVDETEISRALKGAFTIHDGDRARVECSADAMGKFRNVAETFPRFPFSYYALAYCLGQQHDSTWRTYAMKAVEILKTTTTIDGHSPSHDAILRELQQALQPPGAR